MIAMNAASRMGPMMDAAACKKNTAMAMAAAKITAREIGESRVRFCIIQSLLRAGNGVVFAGSVGLVESGNADTELNASRELHLPGIGLIGKGSSMDDLLRVVLLYSARIVKYFRWICDGA